MNISLKKVKSWEEMFEDILDRAEQDRENISDQEFSEIDDYSIQLYYGYLEEREIEKEHQRRLMKRMMGY